MPKTATRECPVKEEAKVEEPARQIPKDILDLFLEPQLELTGGQKLAKISQRNVYGDFFRVTVWINKPNYDSCVPINAIDKSFFVHYDGEKVVDQTKKGKAV